MTEKDFKLGDIFITRNEGGDFRINRTPGYWNHAAILTVGGIVEAQQRPWRTVLSANVDEFINRYPKIVVYRWKNHMTCSLCGEECVGEKASKLAKTLVGQSYSRLASIFFGRKSGENCVSVVRKAYREALGFDPGWKHPDDITTDDRLVLITEKK